MSMRHNDRRQRELSEQLADAFRQYLKRGGKVYNAAVGETALEHTHLRSPQGKARTHRLREAAK